MFVVIFECGEDEFLGGFREVGLYEEVSVEGAEVEAVGVCVEGLFEEDVALVVLIGLKVDLGLSDLSWICPTFVSTIRSFEMITYHRHIQDVD